MEAPNRVSNARLGANLTVPQQHGALERTSSANSERSVVIVAPSPSTQRRQIPGDESRRSSYVHPTFEDPFRQESPPTVNPEEKNMLTPGQALLLQKLSNPFDKNVYESLKSRIAERKKVDESIKEQMELGEAKLVDGDLIMAHHDKLEHDPKIGDGKVLPKPVGNNFPKNLLGIPVEDIDPKHREYDETFLVISRRFSTNGFIFRFSASPSLFLFTPWNPIRKLAIYTYTHPLFDTVIVMTILANSLFMAMNIDDTVPEYTFLAIYTAEAIIKAIARGMILDKFTYLRDAWNWLDFIVILSAFATIIAENVSSGTSVNVTALRTFRVFRVLKTVAIIPGLKTIIEALLRAFKNLADVLIMTFFFFTIFGLFGVQMFQGQLQTKCVLNGDAVGVNVIADWSKREGVKWFDWVSNSSNWGFQDDGGYKICGNYSYSQNCPKNYTCILVTGSPNPNLDFTKFDNFIGSFLIAIQIFNTDQWDNLYHAVNASNGPSAIMFFIFAILFLNFYLANLVQAVVVLSYSVDNEDEDDADTDDVSDIVANAKKSGKRFVFDPWKLRIVNLGPSARARSLQSVRSVTERRIAVVHPANDPVEVENTAANSSPTRPVAIVRPQASGAPSVIVTPSPNRQGNPDSLAEIKTAMLWPGFENTLKYRVKSHPPSLVDEADLPKIGFWDRNPVCCFKCCIGLFPWLKFQNGLLWFVTDPFFDLFITISIVINTISMASRYDGMPSDVESALDQLDSVFTYIFITEAVLKITAMCGEYFDNRWNWLDLLVVIGSLVDIIIENINVTSIGFNTSIIRLLRLLRILKLAQSWKAMRTLLEVIFGTVGAIANLLLVLMIVMFIFAVIGMQLFGPTYLIKHFAEPDGIGTFTPFPGFTGVPEWNWTDFLHSFMMVFRVLCRETYQPMYDCAIANNFGICTPFYLVMLFVGSYVVLNLFLAVLLNAFSGDDLKRKSADEEDTKLKRRFRVIKRWLHHFFSDLKKTFARRPQNVGTVATAENQPAADNADDNSQENDDGTVTGDADTGYDDTESKRPTTTIVTTDSGTIDISKVQDCCHPCFAARHPVFMSRYDPETPNGARLLQARFYCQRVTEHKAFEFTILGFIFVSSLTLCLQDASLKDDEPLAIVLNYMDYIYLGVFTIEMMFKLFGLGVKVYFTSFWTLLDAVIVITGYIDIIMGQLGSSANLSALRALRTLRALRPLRAISRWEGMKIVVNALITAIPGIVNVLLVVMIIWLIFAIMGVQFFGGKFYMCVDVATGARLPRSLVPDKATCLSNPRKWVWANALINFDNVAYSYLALFQVGTFEGWTTVMQYAIDAPAENNLQPYPESNVYYYVFFLVFIVLCSFFLLNLFVGVIIDDFNNLKKRYEGARVLDLFMTDSQKNYYSTIRKLGLRKPRRTAGRPFDTFSIFFYELAVSTRFELAIAGVIGVNVVIMATEHFDQPIEFGISQEVFNISLTVVFALEAIVKIIGLRIHYFRSAWNMFDFTIVAVSILSIALVDAIQSAGVSPSMLRVLRVLRVGRVVRIVRTSKGVRKLMYSLVMSLPALFNIGCLLILVIFIYAIIGMNLFGHVGHSGGNLDDVVNFHTFPIALLTLFRLSTVAGWDNVHQGLSFSDDLSTGCNPNVSISDPNYGALNPCCNRNAWTRPNGEIVPDLGGGGNCGNFTLATIYIISYLLFTYFIVVNMFAAVILDFYQDATNQDEIGVTDEDIERFYATWEQYDPLATQFIKLEDVSNFIDTLGKPLGLKKPNDSAITLLDFPILRDKATGDQVVHCVDILMGLVRKALGSIDETDDFKLVKSQLESLMKNAFPSRVQAEKISTTKLRKKQDVAAKTIQRRWRKFKALREMRDQNRPGFHNNSKKPAAKTSQPLPEASNLKKRKSQINTKA